MLRRPPQGIDIDWGPLSTSHSMSISQASQQLGALGSPYLLQGICQWGFASGSRLLPAQDHVGLAALAGMDIGRRGGDGHKV